MSSTRLFRADPFVRTFRARVAAGILHDGRPAVVLDQTAFYPSAGGQPNDTGRLGRALVEDVVERDDGEIIHVLSEPLAAGDEIDGELDWPRRFDHMQHHSGQHVLSQAFVRACGFDTVSVHMPDDDGGATACTIDLSTSKLSAEMARQAEDEANRIVFDDLPIQAYEIAEAQLAGLPLRRPPKVQGQIRIIEVHGYDWSACGGTHVRSTGQIGLIRVAKVEKRGNDTRVYFRCGGRALNDYRRASGINAQLSEFLSAAPVELPPAVSRLRDDAAARFKALQEAQDKLLAYEGRELVQTAERRGEIRLVVRVWPNRDGGQLRALAKSMMAEPGAVALLAGITDKTALVFARGAGAQLDMRPLLQAALQALQPQGGRGGGGADLAQGGAATSDAARVESVLRDIANGLG